MPALLIDKCREIKCILESLTELPPCNWLITYVECYDTHGWDGCEKWREDELFLSDDELKKDIYSHDPYFIWAAFSAIPRHYTKDEIYRYPLPTLETSYYLSDRIVPQHPLAILEISVFDGCYTLVSAQDESILKPLYSLPYHVRDEEADNQRTNTQLRMILDTLFRLAPDTADKDATEIQWLCYHSLFRDEKNQVTIDVLEKEVMSCLEKTSSPNYKYRYSHMAWNPNIQR